MNTNFRVLKLETSNYGSKFLICIIAPAKKTLDHTGEVKSPTGQQYTKKAVSNMVKVGVIMQVFCSTGYELEQFGNLL